MTPLLKTSLRERLLERCSPEPNTGCWLWFGACNPAGYGTLPYLGRGGLAHRLSYQAFKGLVPPTLTVDHLCFVRSCINPDHLEAVTLQENSRRAARRSGFVVSQAHRLRHVRTHEPDNHFGKAPRQLVPMRNTDSVRLEWLERSGLLESFCEGANLRAAIDAALAAGAGLYAVVHR